VVVYIFLEKRIMNLEAFILGCGGMMPLPGRALTSVLLRREGDLYLFDCGEGTQVSLRRLNLRWKKITAIFISHAHADHVTGLPGILMLSSQVDRDEPLYIVGPPRIREFVEAMRRILEMYINYKIEIVEVTDSREIFKGKGFKVRTLPLDHTRLCMAYTFEEDERPGVFYPDKAEAAGVPRGPLWSDLQAGSPVELPDGRLVHPREVMGAERKGRKFSFVTDTVPVPGIAEFVSDSDLFICEGMFDESLAESAAEKKHLMAAQAAAIARDARARSMGLIHYSPRYTNRDLKILLEEARRIFPSTFLTRDGLEVPIPYQD
jgi:ribonuclease Z